METYIPEPLVTLDPANPSEQHLCQLVIEQTHKYLHRQPLPRFWDPWGNPMTHERVLEYGRIVVRYLTNQLEDLARRRYADSTCPVKIGQACRDWTARHKALEDQHTVRHPAYFAVLDELLKDLVRPAFEPVQERAAHEPLYVAILVQYLFLLEPFSEDQTDHHLWTASFQGRQRSCTCGWCVAPGLPSL